MTPWRARLGMLAIIISIMVAHRLLTDPLANTPGNMLLFHGSAFLLDWLLLWLVAPVLLHGRLLDHSQWLLAAFMAGNAIGWLLYMGYAPPSIYNAYMWVLTAAQWIRLLIPDRTDEDNPADRSWLNMVHHRIAGGSGNHS